MKDNLRKIFTCFFFLNDSTQKTKVCVCVCLGGIWHWGCRIWLSHRQNRFQNDLGAMAASQHTADSESKQGYFQQSKSHVIRWACCYARLLFGSNRMDPFSKWCWIRIDWRGPFWIWMCWWRVSALDYLTTLGAFEFVWPKSQWPTQIPVGVCLTG